VTGQRFQEKYEIPMSRRELRRERKRKAGGLTGLLGRRASVQKPTWERLQEEAEHEVVLKSRRELYRKPRERWRRKWRGGLRELFITLLIAFVLVFGFVRPFVVEAFRIPSESMVPTLEVGDRILANKFVYRTGEPGRDDIVVFESFEGEDDETLIKRVVGVAGDEIQLQSGTLYVNDEPQEEPYLNQQQVPSRSSYGPTTVPPGRIFVMGDNRDNSGDSRIFGPVPLENVKGEAFLRFWPIPKLGPLNTG
jgi:signal peptidase I